jgi:DNA-binding HxlR family transcriptional regulator
MIRTTSAAVRDRREGGCAAAAPGQGFEGVPTHGVAVTRALEAVAPRVWARWKPTILFHLALAPHRRCELDRCLRPFAVSPKVVTDQLRGLEHDGVVVRTDRRAAGLSARRHVTYALSPLGAELVPVIAVFTRWSLHARGEAGGPDTRGRGEGHGGPARKGGGPATARWPVCAPDAGRDGPAARRSAFVHGCRDDDPPDGVRPSLR